MSTVRHRFEDYSTTMPRYDSAIWSPRQTAAMPLVAFTLAAGQIGLSEICPVSLNFHLAIWRQACSFELRDELVLGRSSICYHAEMSEDRSHPDLRCIGSFKAYAQDGTCHTIEIWTYFHAVHDRDRSRIAPGQLVLTTTDGFAVEWIDQGQYRLKDNREVTFSTDDPNAP